VSSLRPSFAERDAFRELLSTSYADGRLDDEQFRARQELVEKATTIDDLLVVADGLPLDGIELPRVARPAAAPARRRRLRPEVFAGSALTAAVLGFTFAGGFGPLGGDDDAVAHEVGANPDDNSAPEPLMLLEPGGMSEQIALLKSRHYDRIESISIYPDRLYVEALVPGDDSRVDQITIDEDGMTAEPSGTLSESGEVFGLDAVAYSVLPDAVAQAPTLIGSAGTVSYVDIEVDDGRPTIRVFVDGDDYGQGSGYVTWSADGQQLLRVVR